MAYAPFPPPFREVAVVSNPSPARVGASPLPSVGLVAFPLLFPPPPAVEPTERIPLPQASPSPAGRRRRRAPPRHAPGPLYLVGMTGYDRTMEKGRARTAQEVFDTVACHLLTQGRRSTSRRGLCRYRGEDGLRCAIGCLIPDELYDSSIEGLGVRLAVGSTSLYTILEEVGVVEHLNLLSALQAVHDDRAAEGWWLELVEVAEWFGLSTQVLDEF